jgi:hypothetical protein
MSYVKCYNLRERDEKIERDKEKRRRRRRRRRRR